MKDSKNNLGFGIGLFCLVSLGLGAILCSILVAIQYLF